MHWAVEQTLSELKDGLTSLYGARLKGLYLFGSHARGEARPILGRMACESHRDVAREEMLRTG